MEKIMKKIKYNKWYRFKLMLFRFKLAFLGKLD